MQVLKVRSISFGFRNQNNYAVLNIYKEIITHFDIQFLAHCLRNSNLIFRADFDRCPAHKLSWLGQNYQFDKHFTTIHPHHFDKLNAPPALSQRERGFIPTKTVTIGVREFSPKSDDDKNRICVHNFDVVFGGLRSVPERSEW